MSAAVAGLPLIQESVYCPRTLEWENLFSSLLSLSVSCLSLFSPLFLSLIRLLSLSTSLYFQFFPSLSLSMSALHSSLAPWLITALAVIVSLLCQSQGEDPGMSPPIRRHKRCSWGFWGDLIPNILQAVLNTPGPSTATNLARSHVFRAWRRGNHGASGWHHGRWCHHDGPSVDDHSSGMSLFQIGGECNLIG